ncbi:hypothetical protein PSYJA_13305 [Pseudomonas syringae pv. japonica str. M301072]|uniref:Uncharacterized protein n=1 Tax=Pseudomonas syringae pv. japonica str. M301072 TaxID=629262 RepID=F3FI48_PSESX|nr:hypothetical protein PSYJA_13305 [Pseudomonas syringae pv. japonica str. M301072]
MVLGTAIGVVPIAISKVVGLLVERQVPKRRLVGGCLFGRTLAGRSLGPKLGERITH